MNEEFLLDDMVEAWLERDDEVDATSSKSSWHGLIAALEEIKMNGIASNIKAAIYGGQASCQSSITEETSGK